MKRILMAVAAAGFVFGSAAHAAEKIAVVDIAVLIKAHPKAKASEDFMKDEIKEFEESQQEMVAAIEKLRDDFKAVRDASRNSALNEKAREEKALEAEEKYVELRKYEQDAREKVIQRQKELNDQQVRMQKRLLGEIAEIIRTYAAKKGFTLVLNSSDGPAGIGEVIYSEKKLDITEDVKKLIEKEK